MGFDFDSETRRRLGYKLIDHIDGYFSSLPNRDVQLPAEQRIYGPSFDSMPEVAADATQVLDDVCAELIDRGFHVPSANYFGLMNPAPAYMAVLAEALVAALNPQLATVARSQLASTIESETVHWIAQRFGWSKISDAQSIPPGMRACDGTFTSGGNEANFSALALALNASFPNVTDDGVAAIGARPVAYASAEAHHSLDKSMGLLGLGRNALRRVPVNARMEIDLPKLRGAIEHDLAAGFRPFCAVATAGSTSSGAIDDIHAMADLCREFAIWLHVDGAYGGGAVFSEKQRSLVSGIERADSITIDPHKWLAMPFAAGVILTTHPEMLEQVFAVKASYMPKTVVPNLMDNFRVSAQWSRRMNSLKFWLTLRVHGRQAFEEMIGRQLDMASSFAHWIEESGTFELAAPQVLPIVNFRLKINGSEAEVEEANRALVEAVTHDGHMWISHTRIAGRSVIRMMVISYLSELQNMRQLQDRITRAAAEILDPNRLLKNSSSAG